MLWIPGFLRHLTQAEKGERRVRGERQEGREGKSGRRGSKSVGKEKKRQRYKLSGGKES